VSQQGLFRIMGWKSARLGEGHMVKKPNKSTKKWVAKKEAPKGKQAKRKAAAKAAARKKKRA
jgi:hypothetical protein